MIRKAVFPVAGMGTRFLPATKACPKEMLPVVDKPLIQYAVEEAIQAGITQLIFVTSWKKRAIEDHFDTSIELERHLADRGQWDTLASVRDILPSHVSCVFVRQPEALGLGHAIQCSRDLVGNEPFAVLLADDLIHSPDSPCLASMANFSETYAASVLAVEEVSITEVQHYGVIDPTRVAPGLYRVDDIMEKPTPDRAPSNLAVAGRYILQPDIFEALEQIRPCPRGELQLTDAIARLQSPVLGYAFRGQRFDCGSKLGLMQANVAMALHHPTLGKPFRHYLQQVIGEHNVEYI
jgi:UTP--glucose-1-phosphate uridylyltransferase